MTDSPSARRIRLRCKRVDAEVTRDSRCRVEVEVDWPGGSAVTGTGEANATAQGRALAGAEAALRAVARVSSRSLEMELRGIRLVRAFDALLVIVAVRARVEDERLDLIGATVAPGDDVAHGAALSFLDATNRLIERYADPGSGGD